MAYKLAVGNKVSVAVALTLLDAGKTREHKFTLTCDRLTEEEWKERVRDESGNISDGVIKKVLMDITTGWTGQVLVLDEESGEPAPCCPEALEVMFGMPGVTDVVLTSYLKAFSAKAKN